MGLGAWVTCSVLIQTGDLARFGWLSLLTMVLWPHLAYLHARTSRDPYRAEIRNLLIDSAIVGLWIPLMHFNLLPCVVLAVITTHDKFGTGIKRLWLYSLPGMVGMAVAGHAGPAARAGAGQLAAGHHRHAAGDCAAHLAVSFTSYRLIRTVARQNQQLKELRQRDAQTGLFARAHWQEVAQAVLEGARSSDRPAWLLMIDIDHFKPINDVHGHTVGDEAIRVVGEVIRESVREDRLRRALRRRRICRGLRRHRRSPCPGHGAAHSRTHRCAAPARAARAAADQQHRHGAGAQQPPDAARLAQYRRHGHVPRQARRAQSCGR
jgi:diguanylate cyclase